MFDGIVIRWSGIAVLIAAFIAYLLFRQEMRRNGYVKAFSQDIFLGCVFFGLLGARLAWYAENGFVHFERFLLFFYDGFETLGGILFASIFLFIYTRKNYMSFLRTLDCAMPQVLLAMAIARIPGERAKVASMTNTEVMRPHWLCFGLGHRASLSMLRSMEE